MKNLIFLGVREMKWKNNGNSFFCAGREKMKKELK